MVHDKSTHGLQAITSLPFFVFRSDQIHVVEVARTVVRAVDLFHGVDDREAAVANAAAVEATAIEIATEEVSSLTNVGNTNGMV